MGGSHRRSENFRFLAQKIYMILLLVEQLACQSLLIKHQYFNVSYLDISKQIFNGEHCKKVDIKYTPPSKQRRPLINFAS